MMNVPYADFYESELDGNDVEVDAVTSATSSKWKNTAGIAKGSYNDNGASASGNNGGKILGVYMPVMIPADYQGSEELTANSDYYTVDYDGIPEYYKVMAVNEDGSKSFSKTYGIQTELSDVNISFTTSSRYGDYEMIFTGLPSDMTVYGIVVSAAEKNTDGDGKVTFGDSVDYGMRHLENIWKSGSDISWSSGIVTKESHGNTLSYVHYESMMGKYITSIKFITDGGIYNVSAGDSGIYVPVKFSGAELSVGNADIAAGTASVSLSGLPEAYEPVYTVIGPSGAAESGFECDGSSITWSGTAELGSYTLKVTDGASKYDSVTAEFELTTSAQAAAFDTEQLRLTAAEGTDDKTFKNYIKNIKTVTVKAKDSESEKSYSASGKGAVAIFDENGLLNLNASKSSKNGPATPVFSDISAGAEYTLTVDAAGYAEPLECRLVIPEKIYAYAALSYAEYWECEDVYAAGSEESSKDKDSKSEYDLGAFDAVTRATTNHGWHRGSYQQETVINTTDGDKLMISHWNSGTSLVLKIDGRDTEAVWDRSSKTLTYTSGRTTVEKTVKDYTNLGIKYVPVAIPADDYAEFCSEYNVTSNGEVLTGGYSENKLEAYEYVAFVDADTNGLKNAVKTGDGWTFGARQTGSGTGILGQDSLAEADGAEPEVKTSPGSYGEFLRMDINGDYGGLGAAMQTVRWDYYGDGDTVKASYGTKFAADNWMHKSMGIQLGLTKSLRCQLPEGTDGSGKWVVTVYGLGYEDYVTTINVTDKNLNVNPMDSEQVSKLTDLKDSMKELISSSVDFDKDGIASAKEGVDKIDGQDILIEHYNEAVKMIKNKVSTTYTAADELINEIEGLLKTYGPKAPAEGSAASAEAE